MRIIVFGITLFLGIYTVSILKPTLMQASCDDSDYYRQNVAGISGQQLKAVYYNNSNFDSSQNYTQEEATTLIGKQVRNLSHFNAKCPKESGNCLELFIGESGKVVGIIPSMNNTFMLEILWSPKLDNSNDRYVSYVGKELSFEIIK